MGLRDKVALVLLAVVVTQLTIAYCMPSLSRKASLQRYLNNFKQTRSNPVPKSPLPTRGIKPTKSVFTKCKQGRSSSSEPPTVSMYKDFNFPEIEYAYDSASKDPFNIAANVNSNIFEKINKEVTNQQSEVIQNLKKEMRIKRKMNRLNDENVHSKRDVPLASCPLSPKSIWLQDQETFPEVQYPLSAVETWTPNYWNPSLFTQNDNQNYNSKWPTFDPNASEKITIFYKPSKQQLKSKTNQFLDEIKRFKEKMRTSTSLTTPNTATGTSGDSNLSSDSLADAVPYVNKETQVITSDAKKEINLINTSTPKDSKSAEQPAQIPADNVNTCADKDQLQSTKISPGVPLIEIPSKGEVLQLPTQSDSNIITPTMKVMEPATLQIEANTFPEIPVPIPYKVFEQSNVCPAYELNNTKNEEINAYEETLAYPGIPIILECTDKANISPPANTDQCITDTEINLPEIWNIPAVNINTCADNDQLQTMGTSPESPLSDIPLKDETLPPSDPLSNAAIGVDYVDTPSLAVQKVPEAASIPFGTSNNKLPFSSIPTADDITPEGESNDEDKQSAVAKAPYRSVVVVPVGDSLRKIQLPITETGTGTPIIVFIQASNQPTVSSTDITRMTPPVSEEAMNVSMYTLSDMSPKYEPLQTDTTFFEYSNLQPMPMENMFEVPPSDISCSKSVLPDFEILPENSMCHVSTGSVSPSTNKTYENYILTDAPFNKDPISINTALDNVSSDIPNLDKPMPIIPIPDSSPFDIPTLDKPMPIIPIADSSSSDIPNLDKPMPIISFSDTSSSDISNLVNSLVGSPESLSSDPTKEFHQPNDGLPVSQPQYLVIPNIISLSASEVISNTPNILTDDSSPPIDKNPINAIHSDVGANNPTNEAIEDSTDSIAINDASQLPAKIPPPDNEMPELPVVVYIEETLSDDDIDIRDGSVSDTDNDDFFMPIGKVQLSNVLNDVVNKDDMVGVEEDNKDIREGSIYGSDKDDFVTPVDKVLPNTLLTDVNKDGTLLPIDKNLDTSIVDGVMKDPKILIDEIVPENHPSDIKRNEKVSPNIQLLTKDIPLPESIDSLNTPKVTFPFPIDKTLTNRRITDITEDLPVFEPLGSLLHINKDSFPLTVEQQSDSTVPGVKESEPGLIEDKKSSNVQNNDQTNEELSMLQDTNLVDSDVSKITTNDLKLSSKGLLLANDDEIADLTKDIHMEPKAMELRDTTSAKSSISPLSTTIELLPERPKVDITKIIPVAVDKVIPDNVIYDISEGDIQKIVDALRDTLLSHITKIDKSPVDQPVASHTPIDIIEKKAPLQLTELFPSTRDIIEERKSIKDTSSTSLPKDNANILFPIHYIEQETSFPEMTNNYEQLLSVSPIPHTMLSQINDNGEVVPGAEPIEIIKNDKAFAADIKPAETSSTEGKGRKDDTDKTLSIDIELPETTLTDNTESPELNNVIDTAPTHIINNDKKNPINQKLPDTISLTSNSELYKGPPKTKVMDTMIIPVEMELPQSLLIFNTEDSTLDQRTPNRIESSDIVKNKEVLPTATELLETSLSHTTIDFSTENKNNRVLPVDVELLETSTAGSTKGYSLVKEAVDTALTDFIYNEESLPIALELSETPLSDKRRDLGPDQEPFDNTLTRINTNDRILLIDRELLETLKTAITDIIKSKGSLLIADELSETPTKLETSTPGNKGHDLDKEAKYTALNDVIKNEESLPIATNLSETPTKLETSTTEMTEGYGLEKEAQDTVLTDVKKSERSLLIPIEFSEAPAKSEASTTDNTNGHGLNKEALDTAFTGIIKNEGSLPIALKLSETPLTEKETYFRPDKAPSNNPLTHISINDKILPAVIELLQKLTTRNSKGYSLDEEAPNKVLNDVIKNQGSLPIAIELSEASTKLKTSTTENTKGQGISKEAPHTAFPDLTKYQGSVPNAIELLETPTKSEASKTDNTNGHGLNKEALDTAFTGTIKNEGSLPIALELSETPLTEKGTYFRPDKAPSNNPLTRISINNKILPAVIELLEKLTTGNTTGYSLDEEAPNTELNDVIKNQGSLPIAIELSGTPTKLKSSTTENTHGHGLDKVTPNTVITDVTENEGSLPIAIELSETPTNLETSTTEMTKGYGLDKKAQETALTDVIKNERSLPIAVGFLENASTPETSTTDNTEGHGLNKEALNTTVTDFFKNEGSLPIALELLETPLTEKRMYLRPGKAPSNSSLTRINMNDKILPAVIELLQKLTTRNSKGYSLDGEAPNKVLNDVIKNQGSLPIAIELSEASTKLKTSTTENTKGQGISKEAPHTAFPDLTKYQGSLPNANKLLENATKPVTTTNENTKGHSLDKEALNTVLTDVTKNERSSPIAIELSETPTKLETSTTENINGRGLGKEPTYNNVIKSKGSLSMAVEPLEISLPDKTAFLRPNTSNSLLTRSNMNNRILPTDIELLETLVTENTKGESLDEKAPDKALNDVIKNQYSSPIAIELPETPTKLETSTTEMTEGYGLDKITRDTTLTDVQNGRSLPIAVELSENPTTPETSTTDNTEGHGLNKHAQDTDFNDFFNNEGSLPIALELIETPLTEKRMYFRPDKAPSNSPITRIINTNDKILPAVIELLQKITTLNTKGYSLDEEAPNTVLTDVIKNQGSLPIAIELSETPTKLKTSTTENTKGHGLDKVTPDTVLIAVTENEGSSPIAIKFSETLTKLEASTNENTNGHGLDKEALNTVLTDVTKNEGRSPIAIELLETRTKLETSTTENINGRGLGKEATYNDVIKSKGSLTMAVEPLETSLPDKMAYLRPDTEPPNSLLTPSNMNHRILPIDIELLETLVTENTKGDSLDEEAPDKALNDVIKNQGSFQISIELPETPTKLETSTTEMTKGYALDKKIRDTTLTDVIENERSLPIAMELLENTGTPETSMTDNTKGHGLKKQAQDTAFNDFFKNEVSLPTALELLETPLTEKMMYFRPDKVPSNSPITRINMSDKILPAVIELLQKMTTLNTKGYSLDEEAPNTVLTDVIKNQGSLPIAIELSETPTKLKTSTTVLTDVIKNQGSLPIAIELSETPAKLKTSTTENTEGHGLDKVTPNMEIIDVTENEGSLPIAIEISEAPTKLETSTNENTKGHGLDKEAPDMVFTDVNENEGSSPISIELSETPPKLETSTTVTTKGHDLDKITADTVLIDVAENEGSSLITIERSETPTKLENSTTHGLGKEATNNVIKSKGSLSMAVEPLETLYFKSDTGPPHSLLTPTDMSHRILPIDIELLETLVSENDEGDSLDEEAPDKELSDVIKNQGTLSIAIEPSETSTKLETSTNENTKGYDLEKEAVDTAFIGIIRNQENLPSDIELLEAPTKEKTSKNEKEEADTAFTDDIKKEGSLPITIELSGNPTEPVTLATENTNSHGIDKEVIYTAISDVIENEDTLGLPMAVEPSETSLSDKTAYFRPNKGPSYSLLTRSNMKNRILHVDIELLETLATKNIKSYSLDKDAPDTAPNDVMNNKDSLPVTMELPETTLPDETKDFRQDNCPSESPLTRINNNEITSPFGVELLETSTTKNTAGNGLDKEAPDTALTKVSKNERGLPTAMELPENLLPDETMHLRPGNSPPDSPLTRVDWNDRTLYASHPLDTPVLQTSKIENTHGLDTEGKGIVPSDLLKNEENLPIGMELSVTSLTDKTMELRSQEGPSDSTPKNSNENDGTLPVDVELLLETLMAENSRLEEEAPDTVPTDIIRNEGSLPVNIESPETLLNNNADDVGLAKELTDSSLFKISEDIMPLSIDHDLSVPLTDEEQLLIDKTIDVILSPDKKYIRDALASLIEKLPVSLGRDLANTELTNLVKYIYLST